MTKDWYKEFFNRLDINYTVLDIGIGTAQALIKNVATIKEKNIHVLGIDINKEYIKYGKSAVSWGGLDDYVSLHYISIYDEKLKDIANKKLFDACYFSGSFSLMPDPVRALQVCKKFLKKGGKIYIT